MIKLGRHSYACNPQIRGEINDVIVGNFTSIAEGCVFDGGFGHDYKNVTSFPLNKLDGRLPGNVISKGDIIIGNDVWIGEGCMIMSGVNIMDGAVIGARSVVTHDILHYQVYARGKYWNRFTDEQVLELLDIEWWNWEDERIVKNAMLLLQHDIDKFINWHI